MKKALIWITVGGLAVAGTAYLLIKQNKKKTGEVPVDNTSLKSNIAQGNSNSSITSSTSTLPSNTASNTGTSQASNAPAPPPPPLLTSQSTPQEIFDLVEAKKLSAEIASLINQNNEITLSSMSMPYNGSMMTDGQKSLQFAIEKSRIKIEIANKTTQLTALGYAIQPYGGVKKI